MCRNWNRPFADNRCGLCRDSARSRKPNFWKPSNEREHDRNGFPWGMFGLSLKRHRLRFNRFPKSFKRASRAAFAAWRKRSKTWTSSSRRNSRITLREKLTSLPAVEEVVNRGTTKVSVPVAADWLVQVDVRIVTPEQYATALHHFTGSKRTQCAHPSNRKRKRMESERIRSLTVGGRPDVDV